MDNDNHLDPTAEINLETVKKRAVKGVLILTGRTFILSLLTLIGTALLTYFLEPSQFGVFWIVTSVVNFFIYFSDIGLAASLIQSKESPTREDLKTTFTTQQILVLAILIVLFFVSPFLTKAPWNLDMDGLYLVYALGFSLLLSSLKTIPSVLMERQLEFDKLVIPQIIENLVYNFVAVLLAWKGFGVASFTWAVVLRGIVGLIAIYILKPWVPGIAFSIASLKKLLKFGAPFQANSLLATLKDDLLTTLLGGILGATGIGFLGWAQKWGQAPLRFFMDHVIKVTFPAFSRMQGKGPDLERSLTRSIFFICFLVFPATIGLIILAPVLVQIIPKYGKWAPALMPLFIISINSMLAAVTTQLTNLLNAIGKIKITFFLMIMWTVLTWALVPIFAYKYGINGAALGYLLVGLSSGVAIYVARKFVKFSLSEAVFKPLISALIMGAVVMLGKSLLPTSFLSFFLLVILGIVTYATSSYFVIGNSLVGDVRHSFRSVFSEKKEN